jgi:hypothetical protein
MDGKSGQSMIQIQRHELFWSRGGVFKVYVDGQMVGTVENKDEKFFVEPGQHRILIKMGWTKSQEIIIQCDSGKTITLTCGFNGLVINTLFILAFISFFTTKIVEPFHLGIQMERRIDIYYLVIVSMITVMISFLPSAVAYLKKNEP